MRPGVTTFHRSRLELKFDRLATNTNGVVQVPMQSFVLCELVLMPWRSFQLLRVRQVWPPTTLFRVEERCVSLTWAELGQRRFCSANVWRRLVWREDCQVYMNLLPPWHIRRAAASGTKVPNQCDEDVDILVSSRDELERLQMRPPA